jgi:hypothetical protein
MGGGNRGPPAHKAWKLYIPIQSIRQGDCPHVITYCRHNRSNIKITMHSDIATDPDFQILKISQKPHASIIIFNIYNAKDANNIHTLDRIKLIPVPQTQNTIYTGNWNLYHADWSLDSSTRG